ncbi:hypothetical protein AB0P21_08885 [Kribbella sp. NPDC056861]|uniref:hypothetical protein n=1 Tax=Kribbella sp. NPDC056861 TaxID=3154857 RepID=UPI0034249DA8
MHIFVGGLLIGALFSGVITGALGGIASPLPYWLRVGLLAPALAVILVFELLGRPLSLPQNRRLVPQSVIPHADFRGPLQFGFEMGTGVRTFTPTALPHALVLVVLLIGGLGPGLLAGLGFGIGRALMPLARTYSGDPEGWDNAMLGKMTRIGRTSAIGFICSVAMLFLP